MSTSSRIGILNKGYRYISTSSRIGILNNDGTVTSIYCHWDGHPEHNGVILSEHYTNNKKIEELISNGNLSRLKKDINPDSTKEHSYDNPQENVCVYYHRDRNDSWEEEKPLIHSDEETFARDSLESWIDYIYLFKDGSWFVCFMYDIDGNCVWEPLKKI